MPFETFVPPSQKNTQKNNNFFLFLFIFFLGGGGGGGGGGLVAEGEHNVQMFKMALLFKEYKCAKLF